MGDGWIKISRKISEHWLWDDAERLKWWIDLLLLANWDDGKVLVGATLQEVKRGQAIISTRGLCSRWAKRGEDGQALSTPSLKRVQAFLEMLELDGIITRDMRKHQITVLTICNYERYQASEPQGGNTCGNTCGNTYKEYKNNKENNIIEKTSKKENPQKPKRTQAEKHHHAKQVLLTDAEHDKLVAKYGEDATAWMIEKLNGYKIASGRAYKSDYQAILNWVVERWQQEQTKQASNGISQQNNGNRRRNVKVTATEADEYKTPF